MLTLRHAAFVALMSSASLSAQAQAARAQAGGIDAEAIRTRRESSNAAIARHDTAGFAAILAEDLIVVASTSVRFGSRQEHVRAMAAQFAARPDLLYRRTPESIRVYAPWQMASEEGNWVGSWTAPDGKVVLGGRYFAKWRFRDGAWSVESETYVPDHCTGSTYCTRAP